ncbi:hypothetical protein MTO96_044619 [Rhipicephalus appendiculatus]
MTPNAANGTAQSNEQANVKKPAQQRNKKKGKHGDDHKQDGSNEAIKSPPDVDQGRERDPRSPEPPGHEQESGQQANHPMAAEPAGQPSALGRMAKKISMSMPSSKKQELSNLAKVGR